MKFQISIQRMHIIYLVMTLAILAGINYVIAQSSSPDPGHSADTIGPGTFAAGLYTFPQGSSVKIDGPIYNDYQGPDYDIWIQGGPIGTTGDDRNLAILGIKDTDTLSINHGGEYAGGTTVGGDLRAGAFYYSSDRSLKENIQEIPDALDRVLELEGVSFQWKDSGEPSLGLVAQDLEMVFPELVSTDPGTGLKSIQYGNLVAVLIEAIKEQQSQIQELQKELESSK